MTDVLDPSLVNWSRAQFALTAMYHWLFVPLTLGLSFLIAFMETIYVRTGNAEWKRATKFWMTLFGINFAIGIATGLILEFEFGTNWSNYSWFVGDIFGAPLAIEGIMAFFMESTFIAVMFFGWNKVSPKFHLLSTWLVAIGSNLSALWILVANGWMQFPAGMHFNPDTARNEMLNFWEVLFSPIAMSKFFHTVLSSYTLASIFVISISAWYLIRGRDLSLFRKSILIAGVWGLVSSLATVLSGDLSARVVAEKQPMKMAVMEGLYNGNHKASLTVFGIVGSKKDSLGLPEIKAKIEIPGLLSILTFQSSNAFVPGVRDLVLGNPENNILSAQEKIERGKIARQTLKDYKTAKENGNVGVADSLKAKFSDYVFNEQYFRYFGYGFLNDPKSIIPNIPITIYSFHIMVVLGFYFIFLFVVILFFYWKKTLETRKWLLWVAFLTLPLPYIASQAGWILAEVGRQPWVIQDYLPTVAAVSQIDASAVQVTFWLFALVFTGLLIAEISIMIKQIKIGPHN
jgi:cytochrome d ubiquinol oxidase subunit I